MRNCDITSLSRPRGFLIFSSVKRAFNIDDGDEIIIQDDSFITIEEDVFEYVIINKSVIYQIITPEVHGKIHFVSKIFHGNKIHIKCQESFLFILK